MLNRKFIVGAIVAVLAFFGILTFALDPNNDGTEKQTPNDNVQEETGSEDKTTEDEKDEDETVDGDEDETTGGNIVRPVVRVESDTAAPTISGVTDNSYYNQDVTITVTEANLDKVVVNGVDITLNANNQYKFSEENLYVVVASDKSNNSTTVTFTIDKTSPEISGVTDGSYYNQDVIITVDEVNLDKVEVNGAIVTLDANNQFSFSEEGEYTVVVTDKGGNLKTVTFEVDKTAPVLTVNGEEAKDFYNSTNLNVKATDDNLEELTGTAQYFPPSSTIVSLSPNALDENGEVTFRVGCTRIYIFTAKDKAGNETTIEFINDLDAPIITGVTDGEYYKTDITIAVDEDYVDTITDNGEEISLDENNQYKFTEEGEHIVVVTDKSNNSATVSFTIDKTRPTVTVNDPDDIYLEAGIDEYNDPGSSAIDNLDDDLYHYINIDYYANEDADGVRVTTIDNTKLGKYKVRYFYFDDAGNSRAGVRYVYVQDTTAPEILIDLNGYVPGTWSNTRVTWNLSATDNLTSSDNIQFQRNYAGGAEGTTWHNCSNESSFIGQYNWNMSFRAIDEAGNVSEIGPFNVKVDNVVPTEPTVNLNNYTEGDWTDQPININLESTDHMSGIQKYQYQLDNDGIWIDMTSDTLELDGNYNSVIKFRSVDNATNASDETRNYVIKEDITAPTIELLGDNPLIINRTLFNNFSDINPGVNIIDNYTTYDDLNISVSGINDVNMRNVGEYYIVYTVTDLAGNTKTATRTVKIIESIPPIISLNNPFYPLLALDVNVDTYTEYGATAYDLINGTFGMTDLTDQIVINGNVDTTELGTYTITYSVTDWSGNTSTKTRNIEVKDKSAPKITLSDSETITTTYEKKKLFGSNEIISIVVPKGVAFDNYDGNVSNNIQVRAYRNILGTVKVEYSVTDSNGNKATKTYNYNDID